MRLTMNNINKNKTITFNRTMLTSCILACLANQTVYAAENTEQVERIEVTGSRIKRVDLEGAVPVTILKAEDLANAGFATVGDALRNSNLNAFGSWGGGANNSWSSQSTVQLKGASAQHTLTLLDGKRMAKSPVLDGGASNLNTIPMAAVERIEILTDGASAIYGTDAIAGVINVILKKDFQGIQFDGRADRPSAKGGDSSNFSFTGGLSSDKGSLVFTIEHYEEDPIMQADRPYTRPSVIPGGDAGDANDWANVSWTGRALTQGNAGGWAWQHPFEGDASCADIYGADFKGPLTDRNYDGDTLCGYDYTNAAASSSRSRRDNTLIHYTYNVTDDIRLTARAYWAKNETLDVSAPVPASISIPNGLPAYTTAQGIRLKELYPDPDAGMKFRFDNAGNRVAEMHDNVFDYMLALDGSTSAFDWDASISYNKYTNFVWGTGYLLDGAQNDLVGHWDEQANKFVGWDPRDPNSPLPGGIAANYDKRMVADYLEAAGGLSFDLYQFDAGTAAMYVGASYREESLDSKVDALAEAGLIVGGNGGSGGAGERDVVSTYAELVLPIIDKLEINLAGRYDKYSDFGSTFNPQISIRYNPLDNVLLRSSWGTGFRAPTLSDLNKAQTEGFSKLTNYIACHEAGTDIDSCGLKQEAATRTGGNKTLDAEESDTYNIGMSWDINDNFSITMDYWALETEGLIDSIDSSEILQTQAKLNQAADLAGTARQDISTIYPGAEISLLPNGRLNYVVAPVLNIGKSERQGLDVSFTGNFDTEFGDFSAKVNVSKYLKYKYSYVEDGETNISEDIAGRKNTPDVRINFSLDYTLGEHSVHYFANYIGAQETWDYTDETNTKLFEIDAYTSHNLNYNLNLPWQNSVSLGVTNLTDEEPKFDKFNAFSTSLYSIRGRTFYMSFQQRF